MENHRWPRLSESELNAFLGDGGTGVISFQTGRDDPPYSLPVSYGYNAHKGHFHFRLAVSAERGKSRFVDRPVSFVAYGRTDDGWRSAVATGTLRDITDEPYDASDVQERWAVTIPFVDIFEESPENVAFRQYVLAPDTLTGRRQVAP
ncbi:pyridoxamine 5'-phosphate oxidase family protein [Halobellus sp. GM3]|uniref:pyridoxamine 5'-phosphate oxidase family protein n=1 Tax=Halobellus sp. GM3 TaxID=3458410 RepID=UPI00403E01B8